MANSAPRAPMAPCVLPVQRRQTGLTSPQEREHEAGALDASPTALTIAMVDECETRHGAADVVADLAGLAASDELVVVYGSDEDGSGPGVQPVVAGLRHLLPRYTVVVLYAARRGGSLGRDVALLDEVLEIGSLPIVVTPTAAVPDVAAELYNHIQADRVMGASYLDDGADLQQMWPRHTAVAVEPSDARRAA